MNMWRRIKIWRAKLTFRTGATVTRFLAPDVRRDVVVVDASEIDDGFIVAKVRTWNVLHVVQEVAKMPPFSAPERRSIDAIFK